MFTGGFNVTPYNRVLTVEVQGAFIIDSDHEISVYGNMLINGLFDKSIELEQIIEAVRQQVGAFILDQTLDMDFTKIRNRTYKFDIQSELEMKFDAARYRVDSIEFTGEFKSGDRIEIDSKWMTFMQNGQNAIQHMDGDFFDLNLGNNEIIYTDNQTNRTVRVRITHRDKYVGG